MKFKPGDEVWARCTNIQMIMGMRAAVVVAKLPWWHQIWYKHDGEYSIEIDGFPCPFRGPGLRFGTWLAWESRLERRDEPTPQKAAATERIAEPA
jgi:hypothetical protein